MAQLSVELSEGQIEALRGSAARQHVPVSQLIKDYADYLLAGGPPVASALVESPSAAELAALAQHGGTFDWLADEPELYSFQDGEPV